MRTANLLTCQRCGGLYADGPGIYNIAGQACTCSKTPLLTEADVRRIVREEIERGGTTGSALSASMNIRSVPMKTIAEQQEEYRARLASGMWPDQALEGSLRMLAEIARLRAELETVTAERDRWHRKYEGACATIDTYSSSEPSAVVCGVCNVPMTEVSPGMFQHTGDCLAVENGSAL